MKMRVYKEGRLKMFENQLYLQAHSSIVKTCHSLDKMYTTCNVEATGSNTYSTIAERHTTSNWK